MVRGGGGGEGLVVVRGGGGCGITQIANAWCCTYVNRPKVYSRRKTCERNKICEIRFDVNIDGDGDADADEDPADNNAVIMIQITMVVINFVCRLLIKC